MVTTPTAYTYDTETDRKVLVVNQKLNDTRKKLSAKCLEIHLQRMVLKASIKEAENTLKHLDAELKAEMDDAGEGVLPNGQVYTYKEALKTGYTVGDSVRRELRFQGESKDIEF